MAYKYEINKQYKVTSEKYFYRLIISIFIIGMTLEIILN